MVYRGAYFGLYDTAKSAVFVNEKKAGFFAKFAVAQVINWNTWGAPASMFQQLSFLHAGRDLKSIYIHVL